MYVIALDSLTDAVRTLEGALEARRHANGGPSEQPASSSAKDATTPAWALMYVSEGAPIAALVEAAKRTHPGLPVFGATSFQGVFSNHGFHRAGALMVGERGEATKVSVSIQTTGASTAKEMAENACRAMVQELGAPPQMLLLHATPGFEERIMAGIAAVFGGEVPVFGGSAADDAIAGHWKVFYDDQIVTQGFLLVGIVSDVRPTGGYLSGYLPTDHHGRVTKASGRTVQEINGRPAAEVYNEWTNGAIRDELGGGNILLKTNLLPLARTRGTSHGMPRRLLSHPHEVLPNNRGLAFFTELAVNDELTLMTSTREPLVMRVRRAAQRARSLSVRGRTPRAGLLVFCGGCLSVLLDQATRISSEFAAEMDGAPFLGIATFGEQGAFFERGESHHGNLMCSAVVL